MEFPTIEMLLLDFLEALDVETLKHHLELNENPLEPLFCNVYFFKIIFLHLARRPPKILHVYSNLEGRNYIFEALNP